MDWRRLAASSASRNDHFSSFVDGLSSISATTVQGVKARNQTVGRVWEEFCKEVLLLKGYSEALLLEEADAGLLEELGLKRRDVGIDMLARASGERWTAVQCKFRARGAITWRQISTFAALCARSGPYAQHLVMTNAARVQREGSHAKDATMARATFERLQRHEWLRLAGVGDGNACGGTLGFEDARRAFLDRFDPRGAGAATLAQGRPP